MGTQTNKPSVGAVFLIGGGWDPKAWLQTCRPFLQAANIGEQCRIGLVLCCPEEADRTEITAKYAAQFETLEISPKNLQTFWISEDAPLQAESLELFQPTGLFVGGGLTPHYQKALCVDTAWLGYLRRTGIPYAGFSAGAAIAARQAIVGGWKVREGDRELEILDSDFGEDLELLEVRPGLGLVPFSIDVHAGQWGTITRLMHAVKLEVVREGWAIDENTMLQFEDGQVQIHGLGYAYQVTRRSSDSLEVRLSHAVTHE